MTAKHKIMLHFTKAEFVPRFNAYAITVGYYEDGAFIRQYNFLVGDTFDIKLGEQEK